MGFDVRYLLKSYNLNISGETVGSLQRQKKPAGKLKLGGKGPQLRLLAMLENIGQEKPGDLPRFKNYI